MTDKGYSQWHDGHVEVVRGAEDDSEEAVENSDVDMVE